MSNLPGNPHAQKFADTEAMAEGKRYSPEIARAIQAAQQMEATMALAHEQRTANLLKVLELQGRLHIAEHAFNLSAFDVAPRLGLGDTK